MALEVVTAKALIVKWMQITHILTASGELKFNKKRPLPLHKPD